MIHEIQSTNHARRLSDDRETAPVPASAAAELAARQIQFAKLTPFAALELALRGEVTL